MNNEFKEEIEALETLEEYNKKIIKALKEVKEELKDGKKPDTDEYLTHIFKGMNWEIQVLNGTIDYINKDEMLISKEKTNEMIVAMNNAINTKDEIKLADIIETEVLPFFENLGKIVGEIIHKD